MSISVNRKGERVVNDGVFELNLAQDAHGLHGILTQPSEELILERNAELRKNPGALRDLSFGRQVASIPMVVYDKWMREYPKLRSPDQKEASDELMRILRLPENRIYCVTDERL